MILNFSKICQCIFTYGSHQIKLCISPGNNDWLQRPLHQACYLFTENLLLAVKDLESVNRPLFTHDYRIPLYSVPMLEGYGRIQGAGYPSQKPPVPKSKWASRSDVL